MERDTNQDSSIGASTADVAVDTGFVDQSNAEKNRLRSALFSVDPMESTDDSSNGERVLARSERPVRKRTPSDLGRPNGKRTLSFGR